MVPLLQAMDKPKAPGQVKVGIIDDPAINAANAGNGEFYVTTGLLQKANDDQLLAVMAHEVAHDDLGHVAKAQALGTGIGIGAVILDQIIPGAGRVVPIAGALIQRKYSRNEEYEADSHGVELLKRVGRNKDVMISTLTLADERGRGRRGRRLLQHPPRDRGSHRSSPEAVSMARRRAAHGALRRLSSSTGAGRLQPRPAPPQDPRSANHGAGTPRHPRRLHRRGGDRRQPGRRPPERQEIFPAKLEVIRAARKSITYAQYVFEEGAPAADIAQALAERCRAGVKVHVLLDAVGSLLMPSQYRDWMTEAGCEVAFYRPLTPWTIDRANYRNHRRILVADGRVGSPEARGPAASGAATASRKASGATPTCGWRARWSNQLQGAFAENWLEATGSVLWAGRLLPAGPSRPRAPSSRRSCAARPRAEAWRCTPCSCSRWPRRAERSTSPIRTSCPTTR